MNAKQINAVVAAVIERCAGCRYTCTPEHGECLEDVIRAALRKHCAPKPKKRAVMWRCETCPDGPCKRIARQRKCPRSFKVLPIWKPVKGGK